jgi:plasmid maintenance system antidote protein VapI
LRLSRALGTSEGFWLGLQADYDLEERRSEITAQLAKIEKFSYQAPHALKVCETETKYVSSKNKKRSKSDK